MLKSIMVMVSIFMAISAKAQISYTSQYFSGDDAKQKCRDHLAHLQLSFDKIEEISVLDSVCVQHGKKLYRPEFSYFANFGNDLETMKWESIATVSCLEKVPLYQNRFNEAGYPVLETYCRKDNKETSTLVITYSNRKELSLRQFDTSPVFAEKERCEKYLDEKAGVWKDNQISPLTLDCHPIKYGLDKKIYHQAQVLFAIKLGKDVKNIVGPLVSEDQCQKDEIQITEEFKKYGMSVFDISCTYSYMVGFRQSIHYLDKILGELKEYRALPRKDKQSCEETLIRIQETLASRQKNVLYSFCEPRGKAFIPVAWHLWKKKLSESF